MNCFYAQRFPNQHAPVDVIRDQALPFTSDRQNWQSCTQLCVEMESFPALINRDGAIDEASGTKKTCYLQEILLKFPPQVRKHTI